MVNFEEKFGGLYQLEDMDSPRVIIFIIYLLDEVEIREQVLANLVEIRSMFPQLRG